jgi:hypothetical protein
LITPKWPFVYQVYAGRLTPFCPDTAMALPKSIHCTVWQIFTVRSLTEIQQTPDTSVLEKILVTQPKKSAPPSPPSNLRSQYHVIWACLRNKAGFSGFR